MGLYKKETVKIILSSLLFCAVLISTPLQAQTPLFTEDFDEANGSESGNSDEGITWTALCPQCDIPGSNASWDVQNGALVSNNTDGISIWDHEPIDISNCDQITVTFIYSGDEYMEAGNLESHDECEFTSNPCAGDVNNPNAGDCHECWDFMDFNVILDGTLNNTGTIGNGLNVTNHTFTQSYNTVGIDDAYLYVTSQTWAGDEFMRMEFASIVCDDTPCEINGTLTGGGEVCPNECTDITLTLEDGTAPYVVEMALNIGGIDFNFPVNATTDVSTIELCMSGDLIPSYDPGTNTLTVPQDIATNFTLDAINAEDDLGCISVLDIDPLSITVADDPLIFDPGEVTACGGDNGMIDLTLSDYDVLVNGGNGTPVNWFLDANATMPAPNMVSSGTGSFYAQYPDDVCGSGIVTLDVIVTPAPEITAISNIDICDQYELPEIIGTNLTGNQGYFELPNGDGIEYPEGTVFSDDVTLYIYDGEEGCEDEVQLIIDITPSPDIEEYQFIQACDSYILPPINGTNLSGFEAYYNSISGGGIMFLPGEEITESITLFAYDENGICSDEEQLVIFITNTPSIVMNDEIANCGYVVLPPISGIGLSGNEYFSGDNNGGAPIFEIGDTIFSSMTIFAYDEIDGCSDFAFINIEVEEGPQINNITNVTSCDYYVLPEINVVPAFEPKYYTGPNSTGIEYIAGDTIYTSTTLFAYDESADNALCFSEVMFDITIIYSPDLGDDKLLNSCAGSVINLIDVLDPNTPQGGTFSDPANTGALDINILDLNESSETSFDILYFIENDCGSDTMHLYLDVVDQTNAGDDAMADYCLSEIINLPDLITGDLGGMFYNANGDQIGNQISFDTIAGTTYDVTYIIGSGNNCIPDTAQFTVSLIPTPEFDLPQSVQVCDFYRLPTITGTNLSGDQIYTSEPDGQGIEYMIGDSIFDNSTVYTYDPSSCTASDSFGVLVNYSQEVHIQEHFCPGETIDIGGVVYSEALPTGIQNLTANNGCDSTVFINLTFEPRDTVKLNNDLCFGQSIMVNNTLYDETNPSGIEIIPNGSISGCDSIISINLNFAQASFADITPTICSGTGILINGNTYDEENPTGQDTLQTISGCDSIITIQVSFYPILQGNSNIELCPNDEIIINGTTYNKDNLIGQETLEGMSANGCDSILNVNITLLEEPEGELVETICAGTEIIIFGNTYNEATPTGQARLDGAATNGCDSLVNITVNFLDRPMGMVNESICPGEETIINGTIFNELYLTELQTLAGQASNGCDSLVQVTIELNEAPVFELFDLLCPTESIEVNGTVYNELNPTGTEIFEAGPGSGLCDSTVIIDLEFHEVGTGMINQDLCEGDAITINGILYDEMNPTGVFTTQTENGCDSITKVQLTFFTPEVNYQLEQPVCLDENGTITIEGVNFGTNPYFYTLDNGAEKQINLPGNIPLNAGQEYELFVYDAQGCGTTLNVTVDTPSPEEPTITHEPFIELISGDTYQVDFIFAWVEDNITWTPSAGLSCADCPNPIANPTQTTTYYYTIISPEGCVTEGSIEIRVLENKDDVYAPNIFTPNRDGMNDYFYLGTSEDQVYDLYIFDRWGNKMFDTKDLTTNDQTAGWDGSFKGKMVNSGVYVYLAYVHDEASDDVKKIQGTITVVR